jgi:hypothetical protein
MTILFEEQEARESKFKEVIQEKINKMKEVDQNMSVMSNSMSNGTMSGMHVTAAQESNVLTSREERIEQSRRRGLRSTGHTNPLPNVETRTRNAVFRNFNEECSNESEKEARKMKGEGEEEYQLDGSEENSASSEQELEEDDDDEKLGEDDD